MQGGIEKMKSKMCSCGGSTVNLELYAGVYIPKCSDCGDFIQADPHDKNVTMFYAFIYTHKRTDIKKRFNDDKEILTEALRAKDVQEEEAYKRKHGMTAQYED